MWIVCKKLISLVLIVCVVTLPVQVYAYGGGGGDGGGGDTKDLASAGAGVGGPPLTFTPPDDLPFDIPDDYENPESEVAGGTEALTYKSPNKDISQALSQWMSQKYHSLTARLHSAMASAYGVMGSVCSFVKVNAKIAIATMAFIGAVAGLIAMAPAAAAAVGITIAGAKATAAAYGAAALVTGALMAGAEQYDKSLEEGKSQTDAAADGLTTGVGKGVIDQAINMNPAFGTIDLIQKAGTGKGLGDQALEGTTGGGTPNLGFAPMAPIDA
ncbi:MAG: hypothetical protein JXO48_03130 [Deltaproteobacteria bacterium]|nr:hypothetical protein [Deltaproteobacteria bacterium]